MNLNLKAVCIAVLLFQLFPVYQLQAQQPKDTISNNPEYLTARQLIEKFEKLRGVRLYYKPEWFEGKKLAASNLNRTPEDFLYLLSVTGKCSYIRVDSATVVMIETSAADDLFDATDTKSTLLVGKKEDFGKYRRAVMSGKITDGKTGETLPGVSVYIDKLKQGTTTDANGQYQMELPVGEFDVTISFIGYEPSVRHIRLVGSGTADLELFNQSVYIQEVVVTQDKAEFNVSRTQMSLIKLDNKSIRELPVSLGDLDIMKSVTLLPGIQSSGEFGTGLFVRGGSADQNLILIEEVPIFNPSHLFGLTSIINPDNISGVTLLKAGIPARYGERSSSLMDIRLGGQNDEQVKVRGGIGLLNSKISLNLPVTKNLAVNLGGRSSYSNWLLHKMPDTDLMNSSAGFYDLNGLLTFTASSNNRFSIFGYLSNDRFGIQEQMNYTYGNLLSSARWNHIFSKTLSSVLTAGISNYHYSTSEQDTLRKSAGYSIKSSLRYKSLKYNLTWIPSRTHSLDFGFNGISYGIAPGNLQPYDSLSLIIPQTLQKEKALEYALYAGDVMTFSAKCSAEVGLRWTGTTSLGPSSVYVYDPLRPRSRESITDTLLYGNNKPISSWSGWEPRLSVRYSFNDNNSLKLSLTRIRQHINLVSNTTVMNPADVWKLSNSYVKPLVCDQVALGFFRNFAKNSYETSLELYYKKMNHLIDYKNGASLILNPALEADLLDASGYNCGAELYIRKNSGRLTGWLSYALKNGGD
ncbi:MAG TPA: TonB-dependent receptor, partial [Prolixibacteraceae bacterium]|nr:TonB-dependent receptor [Prolixibacteraceae bacterium]